MKTNKQKHTLEDKKRWYDGRPKATKKYTMEEIVLNVLADKPNDWFFTWELMGATNWGWLSHATHAVLRKAEQKGLIIKDYIGQYVVYSHKHIE